MESDYYKIFTGNQFVGKQIEAKLKEIGITPIVKNEGESARMAGFATAMKDTVEIHVNKDEVAKAEEIVKQVVGINE
ncbi:putative signal transducing protein [Maribacter sp. 2210JD10-5]|uniref:putative signal transducing protein n=1 Tax=Maribacter sp. 2210JD10-5 TaxID=3386272 RepID=UPI0039BD0EAD